MPNYFSVQRLYAELSSGSIVYSYTSVRDNELYLKAL